MLYYHRTGCMFTVSTTSTNLTPSHIFHPVEGQSSAIVVSPESLLYIEHDFVPNSFLLLIYIISEIILTLMKDITTMT